MSVWLARAARWSAVSPRTVVELGLAPCCSRNSTTFMCPMNAATCSGVSPDCITIYSLVIVLWLNADCTSQLQHHKSTTSSIISCAFHSINKNECTMIRYCMREMTLQQCRAPADAVCYFHSPGGSTCLRELRLQQLSAGNDGMAAILKVWRHIRNPNPSNDSCQISSQSDFKWRSLRIFWSGRSKKNKKNKMSSDMISCTGTKNYTTNYYYSYAENTDGIPTCSHYHTTTTITIVNTTNDC